jgi:lipoate-protein ligase A
MVLPLYDGRPERYEGRASHTVPRMHLVRDAEPRAPALDVAIGHALLQRVAAGESPATLRVYRPAPTVAFGRLDRLRAGYPDAVAAAREHGFTPVVRLPGGHAAAYHEESLGIDLVGATPDAIAGVHDRFRQNGRRLARALTALGIDAQVGEVPGEYCPGSYSVNAGGRIKLAGTAQRLLSGAWLFGAVIVVGDGARVRDVLANVYELLALDWDPATAGALVDEVGGLTVDDVERAVVASYALSNELEETPLDLETLALAQSLEDEHEARC